MPDSTEWCTPFSATVSTIPAESPTSSAPGIVSFGIDHQPPAGSAFAPHDTRSPPSRISRTSGCSLNCCKRSCAEVVASAYSRSTTKPIETRSSPVFSSFIGYSHVPPIWPYFALSFSGHGPIVWIRRSSGLGTRQTSLTPSSQTCGSRPSASPNSRIAAPVRWPQQPSASTVHLRLHVGARLEVAQRLAVLAAALVARAHADDRAVLDDELRRRGLGEDVGAGLLGDALLVARHRRHRDDLVAVVLERRRRRDLHRLRRARHEVDGFLVDRAEREALRAPVLARQVGEELLQRPRPHDRARQVVPAAGLRLLDDRHRHLAERLEQLLVVGQQRQQAVGARQARRAAADDRDADLDQLVLVVEAVLDELARRIDRGRELRRCRRAAVAACHDRAQPFFAFTASVSFGRILLRSPTMPRSEYSKIGALESLLIATMFSED